MRYCFPAVLLLALSTCLISQESRGTLSGRITDSSGSVLASARLHLVNTQTGAAFDSRSNEAGLFRMPYLLPGFYDVSVELAGFKKLDRKGVEIRVNETVDLDLQLALGDVTQSIVVSGQTPLLQTTESTLGQVVDSKRMMELPVASGNPAELVTLAPGTIRTTGIQINKAAFNSGTSQVTTNGNPAASNEFSIDGVPNTFAAGTAPRIAFSAPQAAVAEFKVMTTSYDASIGHTPGAIVNAITTSGTSKFHGELHEFLGGSFLNAPDLFTNRAGQKKALYQDNRYGASVSGPVVLPKIYNGKNKTFFSYVYEANKWGTPQTLLTSVPTPAERQGDFSALLKLGAQYQIYDPYTTVALPNGQYRRSPVPGNILPPSELSPVALAMAKYWPQPTSTGAADGTSNLTVATRSKEDYWVNFVRVDHNFSERNRMFVRLDYDRWFERENLYFNNPAAGIDNHRTNRGLALDHVFVLSPNTIFNVRYGITQQDFPENRESIGFDLGSLGFSQNLTNLIPSNLAVFPNTNFNTFRGFGEISVGDGTNTGLIHSLNGSLSTQRGSHSLHYGVDARLYRAFAARYPYDVAPQFNFTAGFANGPLNTAAAAPLGQDLASFLFGIPQGLMTRSASYATQEFYLGAYFHDDWKVTRRLTLNLGLRIEHESPMTERFDRSVKGFAYTAANPIQAQAAANYALNPIPELPVSAFQVLGGLQFAGGANGRDLWSQPALTYLPRIGLAYQLGSKTVFRGGYGIFYDTIGTNRSAAIQTGFTATTPIIPSFDSGVTYAATLANPFPTGLLAPAGAAGGLTTNLGQALTVYPTARVQPYSQRWSFGFQRELPGSFLLDAAYVGNHAIHLPVNRELNASDPRYLSTSSTRDQTAIDFLNRTFANPFYGLNSVYGKNITRSDLLRPYPEFGSIQETEPIGYAWYHALQAQVVKRFSRGYTLNVAYTFSKSMDAATSFLNPSDRTPWYGISTADRPHRLVVSGIWELPIGKGRAFASHIPRGVDYVIGGWQLNAVISKQSGAPLNWGNVIFNGDIHNITLPADERSPDRWFNVNAGFNRVASQQLASNLRTFPLRFSGIRGDGQSLWNLSAIKYFPITETIRFELRGECFNSLNHPNLNDPNVTPTAAGFGQITAQDGFAREFQVAARIHF
jgi:hypothetical protein